MDPSLVLHVAQGEVCAKVDWVFVKEHFFRREIHTCAGLYKVVTVKQIETQVFCLNPGRYIAMRV